MNMQQPDNFADSISILPVDKNPPSESEEKIINTLFREEQTKFTKFLSTIKEVLLAGALFIFFSLPYINPGIEKFFTITRDSPYMMVGIKTVLFMLTFFILKNFYLVRNARV